MKLAEAAFGNLPASTGTPDAASLIAAEPAIFTGSSVVMRDDDMAAAHVAVCVQGAAWNDADSVPLMVMQARPRPTRDAMLQAPLDCYPTDAAAHCRPCWGPGTRAALRA